MACNRSELEKIVGTSNRFRFFDKNQKGGSIVWQGSLIWENGSYRDFREECLGPMADASWINLEDIDEVRENLNYQRIYCQQKLEDSVKHFEAAKDSLNTQATSASTSGTVPPEKSMLKEVKLLKREVQKWSRKLDNILDKLNPQPEPIEYSKEQMEDMNQNRNDAENFLNELSEIQI